MMAKPRKILDLHYPIMVQVFNIHGRLVPIAFSVSFSSDLARLTIGCRHRITFQRQITWMGNKALCWLHLGHEWQGGERGDSLPKHPGTGCHLHAGTAVNHGIEKRSGKRPGRKVQFKGFPFSGSFNIFINVISWVINHSSLARNSSVNI